MTTKTFTCDACGGTFDSEWTDEVAAAEHEERWGVPPDEDAAVVCDECYKELLAFDEWLRETGG